MCVLHSWSNIEPIIQSSECDPYVWSQYGWVIDQVQLTDESANDYCEQIKQSECKIVCDGSSKMGYPHQRYGLLEPVK